MGGSIKKWFVFYTQFNHEKSVHGELTRTGFLSWLPKIKVLKQWSDRKKWVETPLFPCYNFVYCSEPEIYRVLSVNGIVNSVSFSGERAYLKESDTVLIQKFESAQDEIEVIHKTFTCGELFTFKSGSFAGLTGKVIENAPNGKLVLLLELFGTSVVTRLNSARVTN